MDTLKETGDAILKWGDFIVKKTEEYAKFAKLTFDIKMIELEIWKLEKKTGQYVLDQLDQGKKTIDSGDSAVQDLYNRFREFKASIEAKKKEIDGLGDSKDGEG